MLSLSWWELASRRNKLQDKLSDSTFQHSTKLSDNSVRSISLSPLLEIKILKSFPGGPGEAPRRRGLPDPPHGRGLLQLLAGVRGRRPHGGGPQEISIPARGSSGPGTGGGGPSQGLHLPHHGGHRAQPRHRPRQSEGEAGDRPRRR